MKNKIVFSIISVNFNGGDKFLKSIKSIVSQNYDKFEIIVVDNGSTDDSIENIKKLKLKNIRIFELKKNFGFTVGSNFGVKKSKGKYFMILNNDAYLYRPDFIKKAIKTIHDSPKNIVGIFPKVVFNWEKNIINSSFVSWHYKQLWYDNQNGRFDFKKNHQQKEVFGAMFVAPIFKKKLWLKIGGFDETFFTYGEDFDVSYRANILGYKFLYCPNLLIRHDFRSSSKEDSNPLWSYFYFQRNYLYGILKNYQIVNLIKYFKYYFSIFLNSFKSGIKNRDSKLINLHLRVVKDIISNTPHLLKERKTIQNNRKIDDSKIWDYNFVTNYNPYFYNNKIVINLNSIND